MIRSKPRATCVKGTIHAHHAACTVPISSTIYRWKDIQPNASLGNAKDGWDVDEDWVLYWRMEQSVDVVLVEIRRGGDRIS